jgi:hypothetical protein
MKTINSLEELRKELEEKGVLKPKEKTPAEKRKDKYKKFKSDLPMDQLEDYNFIFDEQT